MPLLLSLAREAGKLDLGSHEEVELAIDELRVAAGGPALARHRHNRWLAAEGRESFAKVDIVGPLVISPVGEPRRLGPYENFSMFDGVGYVDRRVFAFTDLQQGDWYVRDVGVHWPCLRISFRGTGP